MNIPDAIARARDEAWVSDEQTARSHCSEPDEASFKRGFDACLKYLSEQSPAFDEQSACDAYWNDSKTFSERVPGDRHSFEYGARWQFEQDRARIGLAEQDKDSWKATFLTTRDALRAEIKALEARLAKAEQCCECGGGR